VSWLETTFEAQYPSINVTITMNPSIDPYDPSTQATLFAANGPNAVETDTITLGDLAANGYVSPVTFSQGTFPLAAQAAQISGTTYAIPTWVCMYFFTFGPGTTATPNAQAPGAALTTTGSPALVAGTWDGTWTLPALYLTSTANLNGYSSVIPAMSLPLNPSVVAALTDVMVNCTTANTNNCLNGTFKNGPAGAPQIAFVKGQFSNVTGYSESTFYTLANGGQRPSLVQPMVLAYQGANRPLAWTDGLVVNRASCTGQCVADVYTFAQFLNSNQVRNYIAFSGDAPAGTPPRYLSPAVNAFYTQPKVQSNPLYRQFQQGFNSAQNYPNQGYPAARNVLNAALCAALTARIPDACVADLAPAAAPRRGGRHGGK
jgi:thiamine pyridinylase